MHSGEAPMRRVNVAVAAAVLAASVIGVAGPARAQGVTAFEGARLIVGNESSPIENATLIVDGAKIVQVGRAADVSVPAGATRMSLAGKTVMRPSSTLTSTRVRHAKDSHA